MVSLTPTAKGQLHILLALNALYVGFGMIMGVVNGGMPTIMRSQGLSLASAGWLYLLFLPFGLTFLWAPLIDRLRRRSGDMSLIVTMQLLAVATLLLVASAAERPQWQLFCLGMLASLAIATMDLALDALAVQRVTATWRPAASGSKLAALSFGAMLGGGVFVALFERVGWQTAFVLLAVVLAALLLPICLLPRAPQAHAAQARPASLPALFRQPAARRRIALLSLTCCVIFPLAGLGRLMLLDLGVSIERIGWIIGTLGPLSMLLASLLAIALMKRCGLLASMRLFVGLALLALCAIGTGLTLHQPAAAMLGTLLLGAGVGGIYVTLASMILGWSSGSQPATDYAAYYGIGRFASTLATIAAANLIGHIGWTPFYLAGAAALLLVAVALQPLYLEH